MINIIAEIGINHNGDMELAKKLCDLSMIAGFDYVKFQKRTPHLCVPTAQKAKIKSTPWGEMTYLEYKEHIEFIMAQYITISKESRTRPEKMLFSVWDMDSAEGLRRFSKTIKIPSAKLTDHDLGKYCRKTYDKLILSTGMSTEKEIEEAVKAYNPDVLMHTNSVYPTPIADCNLGYIKYLQFKYPNHEIGYSSHYYGLTDCYAAAALGVTWIEKHITIDREMWGSDQKSSVEPTGMFKLVKGIRDMEKMMRGNCDREVYPGEEIKRESLRG
jgi:N-acetylneuraminate synthase